MSARPIAVAVVYGSRIGGAWRVTPHPTRVRLVGTGADVDAAVRDIGDQVRALRVPAPMEAEWWPCAGDAAAAE